MIDIHVSINSHMCPGSLGLPLPALGCTEEGNEAQGGECISFGVRIKQWSGTGNPSRPLGSAVITVSRTNVCLLGGCENETKGKANVVSGTQ